MLIGYNNDVEHRGKTFHIQTEDRGSNDQKIESQLFHGGAILDTKITSYDDIVDGLEGEKRDKKIQSVMKASHRSLFKNVLAGKYDEQVGLEPQDKSEEELRELFKEKISDFQPGQDRVPDAAVELEEEGVEALEQEAQMEGFEDPAAEHDMDISDLKDKLDDIDEPEEETGDVEDIDLGAGVDEQEAAVDTGSDSSSEEEDEPETSIIDPPEDIPGVGDDEDDEDDEAVVADTDKLDTVQVDPDDLDTDQFDDDQLEDYDSGEPQDPGRVGNPPSRAETESEVPFEKFETGVEAWTGCEEPDEDLSIVELVEDYMTG